MGDRGNFHSNSLPCSVSYATENETDLFANNLTEMCYKRNNLQMHLTSALKQRLHALK